MLARHDLRTPRLFGSVARREDRRESDIDLLVEAGPDVSYYDIADAELALEALLGFPVQVVTAEELRADFLERIERDLRPV